MHAGRNSAEHADSAVGKSSEVLMSSHSPSASSTQQFDSEAVATALAQELMTDAVERDRKGGTPKRGTPGLLNPSKEIFSSNVSVFNKKSIR